MKRAIIKTDIAPLYSDPDAMGELADEVLYGMVVEITGEAKGEFVPVRTHYHYTGYMPPACLLPAEEQTVQNWQAAAQHVVMAPYADVLTQPDVRTGRMIGLTRGALVCITGSENEGWLPVSLATGQAGFMRASHVTPKAPTWQPSNEKALRKSIVDTALLYMGDSYRWGGKTPLGIDCSGLVSMAYMLHGCIIYRDAAIKEGFPVHKINLEEIKEGDLLFFPGHVAMYIGDGRYVHATGLKGCDGVVMNSLNPEAPDYRRDLANNITTVGSVF